MRAALGIVSTPMAKAEATDAEVALSADLPRLLRHLVIQCRTAFYVFDFETKKYTTPRIQVELASTMRDALRDSPAEFYYQNDKGKWVEKKLPDLLKEYCTVTTSLIFDLTIQKSRFEFAASTFYEATAPLQLLEPRYDAQIEKWLNLLGGESKNALLDWIASVTDLNKETCALYLAGKKGTGKGMLAAGLARLWWQGPPTELKHILGNFNADIASCPLILLDEAMPKELGDVSGALRTLVGSSSRTLARKHLPNAPLRGALRLIIGANNDNVLKLGDEAMTLLDLEAVAERFLHVHVTPEAADFLASMGGRVGTEAWVSGNLIARHALWLKQQRQIIPGKRFLVEGQPTVMHRKLVMQGSAQNLVFEWISRFLCDPSRLYKTYQTTKEAPKARVGDGLVLVNTQGVIDCWNTYMRADIRTPAFNRVGQILRSIATEEVRYPERTGSRYHSVQPALVVEWASENQVGEPEQLMARIAAKIPPDLRLVADAASGGS